MLEDAVPFAKPPVTDPLACTGAPHVYVVPVGTKPFVASGVNANGVPVQIVRVI